jgi:hypothetical protein
VNNDSRYGPAYYGAVGPGARSNHSVDPYGYLSSPFERHAFIIKKWLEQLGLPGPVLEVGCAHGYLMRSLQAVGVDSYGVDISNWAVQNAPLAVVDRVQAADVRSLPFDNGRFAMVVSFDLLEHLEVPDARAALREAARVSQFQFHQVNTGRLPEFRFDSDETHVTKMSLDEWRALAEDAGVENVVFAEPAQRIEAIDLGPWPLWLPEAPELPS